jgi:CSLREA domain-containing protein
MSRHPQVFISTAVLTMVLSLCLIAAERPSVLYAAGDFIVTTTQDIDGTTCGATCSLRQAINAANASGGGTVKFNLSPVSNPPEVVPGGNAWRITLSSGLGGLPALEAGTDVDGTSQGVARPSQANLLGPEIIIDGTNVPGRSGITIASVGAASEVKGLSIINFNSSGGFAQGVGINVTAGSGHILRGNFVGVEANGSTVGGNGFAGIWVQSLASNVTIGGDVGDTQQVNVVSGNDLDGILLQGNGNTVQGNYIGTNFRGSVAVPNQGAGIRVYSSNDNVIGPKDGQEIFQNIIAGNRDYGIVIDGGRNTEVAGNYIGLGINQVSGINDIALPNVRGGVEVNSDARAASGNKVGVAGRPRNFISANTGPGVRIRGTTTTTTRRRLPHPVPE